MSCAYKNGFMTHELDSVTLLHCISNSASIQEIIVPGWRVGWILIHDRHDRFKEVMWSIFMLV